MRPISSTGDAPPTPVGFARTWRWIELIALFVASPAAMWMIVMYGPPALSRWILVVLVAVFVGCLVVLVRDREFDRRQLWNQSGLLPGLKQFVLLAPLPLCALLAMLWLWQPSALFAFPRDSPRIYALVMFTYPLLSVFPQEVIWRTFFFHRYEAILGRGWPTVAASAIAFGWMHCVFNNWIAVVLTMLGGLLFAYTYHRMRSTAAVWIEHALWGCLIFTIGLGKFFYLGGIRVQLG